MPKLLLIATDMDDTVVDTYGYILPAIRKHLREKNMLEELKYVDEMTKEGKTSMMFKKEISNIIFKEIVEPGHFMLDADPSLLVQQGYFDALGALQMHFSYLVKSVVCTHRGFNKNGGKLTNEWLIKNQGSDVFDEIHCIDPKEHPDKIKYLQSIYPDYEILLLDDNPFGNTTEVREPCKEVVIYDAINKFDCYSNQNKFTTLDEFIKLCISIIRS